jgi:hypothetical protein
MALGFALPEVKFLNITLGGGTDVIKKTDEPHTAQEGSNLGADDDDDLAFTGMITNQSDTLDQASESMKVDIILGVKVSFDITSNNIYSSFFKTDFAKYLKNKSCAKLLSPDT